ncbi:inner membrane peptidase [Paraperlucidibaca baekdonensis]|uniref:Inner membrane peptidase n=1 Tax=Paraperlucidibaca baekdonensis TaxID=748120 RepID=A0A3E0H353_9GAMM|nr:protease SohB [Paraperlucidibaca baekdonensis]REH36959.1 inner membrane peptidase [Paraperlucidibaca baekdonensis]
MLEWFANYGLFLAKGVTVAVLVIMVMLMLGRARRGDMPGMPLGHLAVEALNDRFDAEADALRSLVWDDAAQKAERKARKAKAKAEKKAAKQTTEASPKAQVYVLRFTGDMAASAVAQLRHEISALLAVAVPERDEVVLVLESPGGLVHSYGLASSQLARIRAAGIRLTICVDAVAASGGYMMACLADQLIAAPFAVIGSIGVVAQIPNVHRLLKKNDIDVELMTAGQYKRTLTMIGENTDEGRAKFQEDLNDTHELFKAHVAQWRSQVDLAVVATGEHWYGQQALSLGLVDSLQTSDDYLRQRAAEAELFALHWREKKTLGQRLGIAATSSIDNLLLRWWQRSVHSPRV